MRVVIDTNVLVSALRSRRGAAYRLLNLVGTGRFEIVISVPLVLEYEDVARRLLAETGLTIAELDVILDYLCAVGYRQPIFYLWRPFLRDPKDDMVLELAVASHSDAIVTYNRTDFEGAERFGLQLLTPAECLKTIGVT